MMRDVPDLSVRIAYLVNQYPKVSHSFIRREIQALERSGLDIARYALRGWNDELVDTEDLHERDRTRYLLREGVAGLFGPLLLAMLTAPLRFGRALRTAWRLSRRSDRRWWLHLASLAEACRLARWLRRFDVRHLHAHFGTNSAEVAMLAHMLCGVTYSFTVHGPEEFDKPEFIGLRDKVGRAAFVVAISSHGRSQLLRWIAPEDWHKVHVVHCGIEIGYHACACPQPLSDRHRLVCVGRLCAQKGQLLLIEAAAILARKGVDFDLVLAGDGEMRAQIEDAIARNGLASRVRITGWISAEEVRAELAAARALVLPSFAEGLPVVLMEAMAMRRPALTTLIAGIPELVVHGETGWLFPAGSVEDLVAAIIACLETSCAELERMGEMAQRRVRKRHDIDREATRLAALYHDAVIAGGARMRIA